MEATVVKPGTTPTTIASSSSQPAMTVRSIFPETWLWELDFARYVSRRVDFGFIF